MWIPALSAIGAGFAIGLAAIGSGVGQAHMGAFIITTGRWGWGTGVYLSIYPSIYLSIVLVNVH